MPKKPKLAIGTTPARLVAVVRATDERAALAEVITRDRIPLHVQTRLFVIRTA